MGSLPKRELIDLYARRSLFFFLRLDLLLLLHCRLRLLHGKLLEHLAIVKFALCHFVSRGSMVWAMMVRAARTAGSVVDWASATHCAAVSLNSSVRSVMARFQAAAAQYTFQRAGR